MARLDHIQLNVRDWRASRDWWGTHLGFEVEFEIPDANTVAMKDEADLTIFFCEGPTTPAPGLALTVQVADVEDSWRRMSDGGIGFAPPPQKVFWGYGVELLDPDGYRLRLWDQTWMQTKAAE